MKKWFVIVLAVSFSINAMRIDPEHFAPRPPGAGAGAGAAAADEKFVVDAAFIQGYLNDHFSAFLDAKKAQRETLTTVNRLPFASTALKALGIVDDAEHAQAFLDRMFKDGPTEQAFRDIAGNLADNADNVAYLKALFAKVDPAKVTQDKMKDAMKEVKHALVPDPSLMGDQDDGTYTLTDDKIHPWAACNMFAFYWIEQRDKQNPKRRGLKKGGSGLFKN